MKALPGFGMVMVVGFALRAALIQAAGVVAVAALALCGSGLATAQTITEFPIPTAASVPIGITAGPDSALWFVEAMGNKIGRITTGGAITEYPIPTTSPMGPMGTSLPQCIVAGPDGALWFTEAAGNKIGRITTAGVITEFPFFAGGWPHCLTVGPDGALWIADRGPKGGGAATGNGSIGRLTTAGVLTRFAVPTPDSQPTIITPGSDGALWFTMSDVNKIGRITTAGAVTEFTIPTPNAYPMGIAPGPDGALWFAENVGSKIGRITTSGSITEFTPPTANSRPMSLYPGPDGAMWFTEAGTWASPATGTPVAFGSEGQFIGGGQKIGRITTSGTFTEFVVPTANGVPNVITVGSDGALWFTEAAGNKIGRLSLPPGTLATPTPFTLLPPPQTAQTVYTAPSGQLPAAAVAVSATGTFGSASLSVTLDIVKGLPATFAASTYNVYVAALVPGAALGSASPVFFVKAKAPGSWGLLQLPITAFMENVAQNAVNNQVVIEILANTNLSTLVGTEFYLGYGTSDTEMLAAGRYRGIYRAQ